MSLKSFMTLSDLVGSARKRVLENSVPSTAGGRSQIETPRGTAGTAPHYLKANRSGRGATAWTAQLRGDDRLRAQPETQHESGRMLWDSKPCISLERWYFLLRSSMARSAIVTATGRRRTRDMKSCGNGTGRTRARCQRTGIYIGPIHAPGSRRRSSSKGVHGLQSEPVMGDMRRVRQRLRSHRRASYVRLTARFANPWRPVRSCCRPRDRER